MLRAAEKLVGLKHEQFTFSIEDIPLYQRVIWDRESIFVEKSTDIARQVLPPPFNKAAGELVKLFNTPRLVIAPLISGDDVFGAFIVQSEHLTQDDVPTITAFAYQVAATWSKTNLIHSLEESFADLKETQDQLLQAQRMEAVGRLAGGVAHDFNNLLTAISGYAELLLATLTDGGPPDHQSRQMVLADLQEIRRAAERARGVTQQLLAFSRRQVLEPRVIDLNVLVENIEKMLHRLIGENIRFRTIFSPSLWRVLADPGQLEQVILNLAINARDAMPTGGRLTIETYNVTLDGALADEYAGGRPGEYVVLIVNDTGTGIDEELLPHIFEPFFTTKEEGQGTGLGLATVYGIVTQSNGFIEAESKPGRGTTFRVFLPRTELSDETCQRTKGNQWRFRPATRPSC